MLVQVKERIPGIKNRDNFTADGVLIGTTWRTHDDGPIEIDDQKAQKLITAGFVNAVAVLPQELAERAVEPQRGKERRA